MPKLMLSEKDREDFQQAMQGVEVLSCTKTRLIPREPFRSLSRPLLPRKISSDVSSLPSENIHPEASLFFARVGVQQKLLKNFQKGKYKIQEILDLHGMIVAQAQQITSEFIDHALQKNYRYIQIIPGKGWHLKSYMNQFLKQLDCVLAFCSALPKDGGTGALYVLLKKR